MKIRWLVSASIIPIFAVALAQALTLPADSNAAKLPEAAQASISAVLGTKNSHYRMWAQGASVRTENTQQNLSAEFGPHGLAVRSQGAVWKMTLRGFGYGNALKILNSARPEPSLNRVSYRHGAVIEWYVNGPLGLEQGFTIGQPMGPSREQPLTIALVLAGNLSPSLDQDRRKLSLKSRDGGTVLQYSGLSATDAAGNELKSWLELRGSELYLKVEDAGAQYPIVVDPFIQQAELTASDASDLSYLGLAVAISGNTVVAGASGAFGGQGSAYVFVKPASGWANMTQTAELSATDIKLNGEFGLSVAISGNTIVVGAFLNQNVLGAAYVYVKPPSGWTNMSQTAELNNSDAAPDDFFGDSVSVSGDTVVVGAPFATIRPNSGQGAAYVFVKPSSGWKNMTETAKLTASDGAAGDTLGASLSISSNTIVAGATGVNSLQGAAYVFVEPAGGWTSSTQTAKLTASDGAANDVFGSSVAIGGVNLTDTIVAGAPSHNFGAAYVFVQPSGGWVNMTQTAELTSSQPAVRSLGSSVAISGNGILVGAPDTQRSRGAVLGYTKPASGWVNATQNIAVVAADGSGGDRFGYSLGFSGSVAAIGAPNFGNAGSQTGVTYVFAP